MPEWPNEDGLEQYCAWLLRNNISTSRRHPLCDILSSCKDKPHADPQDIDRTIGYLKNQHKELVDTPLPPPAAQAKTAVVEIVVEPQIGSEFNTYQASSFWRPAAKGNNNAPLQDANYPGRSVFEPKFKADSTEEIAGFLNEVLTRSVTFTSAGQSLVFLFRQPFNWWIFGDEGEERLSRLPAAPPWRRFDEEARRQRGKHFLPRREDIEMVNAALYLRRPLLITGGPELGKTSLTYAVAENLNLGEVLRWSITTATTLKEGLYHYDAIARLQDASLQQAVQAPTKARLKPRMAGKAPDIT